MLRLQSNFQVVYLFEKKKTMHVRTVSIQMLEVNVLFYHTAQFSCPKNLIKNKQNLSTFTKFSKISISLQIQTNNELKTIPNFCE